MIILQNRFDRWKLSRKNYESDYGHFNRKIFLQALVMGLVAFAITSVFYTSFWYQKGENFVVSILENIFRMDSKAALDFYRKVFVVNSLC